MSQHCRKNTAEHFVNELFAYRRNDAGTDERSTAQNENVPEVVKSAEWVRLVGERSFFLCAENRVCAIALRHMENLPAESACREVFHHLLLSAERGTVGSCGLPWVAWIGTGIVRISLRDGWIRIVGILCCLHLIGAISVEKLPNIVRLPDDLLNVGIGNIGERSLRLFLFQQSHLLLDSLPKKITLISIAKRQTA